jgi:hypothetical protein
MHHSLQITFSRRGLLLAAIGLAALLAGPALAIDRPAASFYTPKQLEVISQSWAARGGAYVNRPAASFYTPQQLEVISQSWAARGGVFVDRPAASFYTPQQLEAISQSWAARGRHASSTFRSSSGLDWSDVGIGAGGMLGLVLVAGGLAGAVHLGRRSRVRARPVS